MEVWRCGNVEVWRCGGVGVGFAGMWDVSNYPPVDLLPLLRLEMGALLTMQTLLAGNNSFLQTTRCYE